MTEGAENSKGVSVTVRPYNSNESKTIAFVDIAVPTALGLAYFRGATLVNGSKGVFLQLPSHKSTADYAKNGYADNYYFDGKLKQEIENLAKTELQRQTAG